MLVLYRAIPCPPQVLMSHGQGSYALVSLLAPKVGPYQLLLASPFGSVSVDVEITEGRPQWLAIKVQPSRATDNRNRLQTQPRLQLEDGANNVVLQADTQLGWQQLSAVATGRPPGPRVLGQQGFQLGGGGGVNRAPQNWGGGVWEKGSIDRTIHQSL